MGGRPFQRCKPITLSIWSFKLLTPFSLLSFWSTWSISRWGVIESPYGTFNRLLPKPNFSNTTVSSRRYFRSYTCLNLLSFNIQEGRYPFYCIITAQSRLLLKIEFISPVLFIIHTHQARIWLVELILSAIWFASCSTNFSILLFFHITRPTLSSA